MNQRTKQIKLSNDKIQTITNQACRMLYQYRNNPQTVLGFVENGDTIIPKIYTNEETGGKADLFPRNKDTYISIYTHLGILYGNPDEIFL